MPRPFLQLSVDEFAERLRAFTFSRRITAVHMHHTFIPRQSDYTGESTIEGMFRFHTETNGWSDIAQHLSIAPDGSVWTGRDWNRTPASATGFNQGVFMFETIGDFDVGEERLDGAQRRAVVNVIALVQLKCDLPLESLHFHREFTDAKTCPGTGVSKAAILAEVREARALLAGGARAFVASARVDRMPMSRRASVHEMAAASSAPAGAARGSSARPFADAEVTRSGRGPAAAAMDGDDGELDCDSSDARFAARDGMRGQPTFSPDDLEFLRRHVVNLRQGQFSGGGIFETGKADVNAMFGEHLPQALAEAKRRGEKLRVLVWAHGGLVDEESGLSMARAVIPWWLKNRVYPIYFVWETGLFETITQLIKGRRELAARDIFDLTDGPIEDMVRAIGGGKIWDGMKLSAQRSVEADGGARYVAEQLAKFCEPNAKDIELHAAGHSAGAIFHAHFIPTALDLTKHPFATVSFLAPALRVSEFITRLAPRLGGGVDALTMYTMRKSLERADNCAMLYRKSLLYLIHSALEAKRGEPILGLEESIHESDEVMKLFGLNGPDTAHHIVFAKTESATGRSATRSTSHGGFDNDRSTMESVLRHVINASDDAAIEPFPAEATRDFSFDASLARSEFAAPARPAPVRIPPSAPTPASPTAGNGRRPRLTRALCVGIDEYPTNALTGCVNDAKDWRQVFQALGFEQVQLIQDEDAKEARLRQELRDLVASGRPGDALAFQYSGHGTFFRDQGGAGHDEEDNNDEAMVPVDFPDGHFILDDELFEIFDALRDGVSLTCFFDCCHSGTISRAAITSMVREGRALGDADVHARFIQATPTMEDEYRRRRGARRGLTKRSVRTAEALKGVVFSACRDDEVALESAGHGAFTSRVSPLIRAAFDAGATNEEFQRRIVTAFGAGASQHPALDCASAALGRPLLRLGERAVTETEVPVATPHPVVEMADRRSDENGHTAEAWHRVGKLIHDAQQILDNP